MQKISNFLPLTHSLEAVRQSLLAAADIRQIWGHLRALLCFIVILIPISIIINKLCMKIAKKKGAFSTH
jgi:hypothetical protein